jgi:hypothetical protein
MISFAKPYDLACEEPLFGAGVLKPDSFAWSKKWKFATFWQIVVMTLSIIDFQITFFNLVLILGS